MTRKIVIAIIIALLVAGAAAFFATHERVTEPEYTGLRGEARVNRFLAAELLLENVGIEAESIEALQPLEWMPDYGDTIFTRLTTPLSIQAAKEYLLDWSWSGGHLVLLVPEQSSQFADELLFDLGLGTVGVDPTDEEYDAITSIVVDASVDNGSEAHYEVDLILAAKRLVNTGEIPVLSTLSDSHGILAIRLSSGDGYITVVADDFFFDNLELRSNDHARLLLDIVDGFVTPGKVWLVYDASFTPLWQHIWNFAPYAVLSFVLLLLVSMWSAMPGFGPRINEHAPVRRSIVEHIRAAGIFVWKLRSVSSMSDSATRSIMHRAASRHPGIGRLSTARQAELIAQMSGLDAQTVHDAITNEADSRTREFTQHMKTLQQIGKQL